MLFPGGGTSGVEFMAEQLNHTQSEVVYVDFSKTSMLLCQMKVRLRTISNTVWVTEWIEGIPRLGIGNFDFVSCTGVLHHLKSFSRGLNIIKDAQVVSGGAALVVYAKYGRTGIYQIQDLLRVTNKKENNILSEISNSKLMLQILPKSHWFDHSKSYDINKMGDIGIFDLLLHKRDVAFSIYRLYQLVQQTNFNFIDFALVDFRIAASLRLRLNDTFLYKEHMKKSISHQQWIAEITSGRILTHQIYISRHKEAEASLQNINNVIFADGLPTGFPNVIDNHYNYIMLRNETFVYATLSRSSIFKKTGVLKTVVPHEEAITEFAFPLTNLSRFIITSLTKPPMKPKSLKELIYQFKITYDP